MTPNMISACEAHAITFMQAQFPSVPILMSGQPVPRHSKTYVRFWVLASEDVIPVSIGGEAKSRNVGVIQADVYGPKDEGAGPTGDIAFALGKSFHRLPVEVHGEGWVVFKDAGVKDMGDEEEEHRQMMRVPYRFDFKI
ncbi:hypothetical protein MAL1_00073 [Bacteriophage DSS3_MAL1]|nr:hypothetical protein MAL1_00073 [Bacteriophage DSS3_MAL1]